MSAAKPASMNTLKIVEVSNLSRMPVESEQFTDNGSFLSPSINNVVTLNVGGTIVTTSLSTLRKYPESMLAAMFSGRHHLATDEHGRYFIDRDGKQFIHILNFLRQNKMPPLSVALEVYDEAQYYNVTPLISALSLTRPVAGYKIRKMFIDKVPNYEVNIETLIQKALEQAILHPDRATKLLVCIFKEDSPSSPYDNSMLPLVPGERNPHNYQKNHCCDVSLAFGPWDTAPDVYDLIHCIKLDVEGRGYTIDCQCIGVCDQHLTEQFYCKRPIYEFKFKWW